MNRIHRSLWNDQTATCIAVAENTCGAGKQGSSSTASASSAAAGARFALKMLSVSLMMACGTAAWAEPTGGVVSAGSATIGGTSTHMVITQTTANVAINWQSFSIAGGEWVQFVQPDASSVALNRVVGPDPSSIMGNLTSNGKVFLVNPNGILFGTNSTVNVGGLVASTLGISDADFMASNYRFSGAGTATVENHGALTATDGGYVALLGANVSNRFPGLIRAQLGTVALAAGNAMTLDMAGDKLLSVTVGEAVANALVSNNGTIQSDGGSVLMTTQVAGSLLSNAVNNTGVIDAQTLQNVAGTIRLLGGMETGTVNVTGSLNADASGSDNGGFVETSAARVAIAPTAMVSTAAVTGESGEWLVGSGSFSIGGTLTDNIAGTTLSALLVTNNVTISTAIGADGAVVRSLSDTRAFAPTSGGDIDVKDALAWKASSTPTTLTLLAGGDVNIDAAITATKGNLVVCCGRDVNVNAAVTTTNGSVLLSAGRDVDLQGALSTTDGNVTICAANDILIGGKITLTHTTDIIPGQSLGLPLGLVLTAGYGAGAPGADGGTVVFAPLAPPATVTNAPTTITYNPVSYTTPTDYAVNIIGTAPVQRMLVFAQVDDKVADGNTTATVSPLLQGNPLGDVSLVAGAGSTATFDSAAVGTDRSVTLTGYSLGGADAGLYALAVGCCGPVVARTTASITAGASLPSAPPASGLPPSPHGATPVWSPAMGTTQSPSFLAPFSLSNSAASGYVLTVLPAEPLPSHALVVAAPAEPLETTVATPAVVPRAPPAVYRAPVRRPKVERN